MPKQGAPLNKGLGREIVRDLAGFAGIAAVTGGTYLKFGAGVALIVGGVFVLALVVYDGWAAD